MATAAGEFSQAVSELSSSEEGLGPQLASVLSGLAAVERKVQEMQDKQSEEDTLTIMSTGAYYIFTSSLCRLITSYAQPTSMLG